MTAIKWAQSAHSYSTLNDVQKEGDQMSAIKWA
jgi:hypothetical protein